MGEENIFATGIVELLALLAEIGELGNLPAL
jgi:hypothetical protein